jgi:hypothetical protein
MEEEFIVQQQAHTKGGFAPRVRVVIYLVFIVRPFAVEVSVGSQPKAF